MTAGRSPKSAIPRRGGYGSGIYRRHIRLRAEARQVSGELVDDFHRFSVRVRHDGELVERIEADPIRIPWTTCPGAVEPLRRLEGALIGASLGDLYAFTAAREQCTHMHDLAVLAVRHAKRAAKTGVTERRYDVALPDRVDGSTRPTVSLDGVVAIDWHLQKSKIETAHPSDFAGYDLTSGKLRQAIFEHPDQDFSEAAFVLQRAIFIGAGRLHDFDAMPSAGAFASVVGAACHSFSPERVDQALRIHGTVRDFTNETSALLDDPNVEPARAEETR